MTTRDEVLRALAEAALAAKQTELDEIEKQSRLEDEDDFLEDDDFIDSED